MPKITSATVAEHRVAQRGALLAAAEAIISEQGLDGVTPRSVAETAGLARSSFYEYFPSRDDLLAAIALAAFEEWARELNAAVAAAPGPERLSAYVQTTLRMTGDGKHALATDLQQADLSPKSFDAIMQMHDTLSEPLRSLLADLGMPDPGTSAVLVQGLINAGMQLVSHGSDPESVAESVNAVLRSGIAG